MLKKKIAIAFLLLILLSGCQPNVAENLNQSVTSNRTSELESKIQKLEEENKRITALYNEATSQLENLDNGKKLLSVSYIGYEDKYRFVGVAAPVLWMPVDSGQIVSKISNKTVTVLFAGYTTEEEVWLFISFRTYDTPSNNRGWIQEKNTAKYTKECQKLTTDVIVSKGTLDADNNLLSGEEYDRYGMIEKRENNKVLVMFGGGAEAWYFEKDLAYLPLE